MFTADFTHNVIQDLKSLKRASGTVQFMCACERCVLRINAKFFVKKIITHGSTVPSWCVFHHRAFWWAQSDLQRDGPVIDFGGERHVNVFVHSSV